MKRLNPNTSAFFKRGDLREDGSVFYSYRTKHLLKNGFFCENWLTSDKSKVESNRSRQFKLTRKLTKLGHIKNIMSARKCYAKQAGWVFDVSAEYLLSIAPDNCPVFNKPLLWCSQSKTAQQFSPSLDKIVPELGYIEGNVQWISHLANAMKRNASLDQLKQFGEWAISQSR
jgi:hypothetical protein